MSLETFLQALFLGLLEGLTEFIPVSSTGHILLAGHFLGFENEGKIFEVLIQLGAILAVLSVYTAKLLQIAKELPTSARARRFVAGILVAFLPAAFAGVLLHEFIKTVLFETPALICTTLIIGGVILLIVDRLPLQPKYTDVMDYPLPLCLGIGLCQCLALIPGVSRSGSTIVGSLLIGTDKRSAAEFTFFLAMPTMAGAFVYDLYQNRDIVTTDGLMVVAVGFVSAFFMAVIVVRWLLDYVSKHGFALFAWWRIIVGSLGFVGLALLG
ncbi:MAG: undecaprenyl-diphosphate phosphatase [Devosiaceae bacterium]|nr:undecaprenyl-diphosphate phosphatase [Devosiaceae bacterium MH13]